MSLASMLLEVGKIQQTEHERLIHCRDTEDLHYVKKYTE